MFDLDLPLQVVAPAIARAQPLPSADASLPLAGLRILVAEDNPVNQMVIEDFLSFSGAKVELAENGRQALERVQAVGAMGFDLVLMDIQMPVMNGHEAARAILRLAPGLPIIGQTGNAFDEEREQCLASGMVDHIGKPMSMEDLVARILMHARSRDLRGPVD